MLAKVLGGVFEWQPSGGDVVTDDLSKSVGRSADIDLKLGDKDLRDGSG